MMMTFIDHLIFHRFYLRIYIRTHTRSRGYQFVLIIHTHQEMINERLHLFLLFFQCILAIEYVCNPQDACGCSGQPVIISEHMTHQTVRDNSWNWLVSLRDTSGHLCDGSIISERYVITAAHCLQKTTDPLSSITICVGANRLSDSCEEQYAIDSFICYPSDNDQTRPNEIALVRVHTPFDFTDQRIARICLPDDYLPEIRDVIAVSWKARKLGSNRLQQMRMQIVDESRDTYSVTSVQLCADALRKSKIVRFNPCLVVFFFSFR